MWASGVVAAVFLLGFASSQHLGCRVFPNHLRRNSRLLLVPNSSSLDGYRFLLPHAGHKFLYLQHGQQLDLACPTVGFRKPVRTRARCETGSIVEMSDPPINRTISEITCRREPRPMLRSFGRCMEGALPLLGVGFVLGERQLVRMLEVCYDIQRLNTRWVRFTLMQGVEDARQKHVPRPPTLCPRHFGKLTRSFDKLYDPSFQHFQFQKSLGSAEAASRYVNESAGRFLVQGMLASHHDFVYYPQQKVGSFCVNRAPMWHSISTEEWRLLGVSLRRFASRQGTDLTVYSGTYGHLKFAENNELIRLGKLTVPAMLWKLVYDRLTFRGIIFILQNTLPHLKPLTPPCHDMCREVASSWFNDMPSLNSSGRVRCCSVYEFLNNSRLMPEFRDTIYSVLV